MKKTFRSILAGALSLLAVSCYDDSGLREEISGVKDRLDAIEETLNSEVGGINDLISRIETLEGQIAAINVETKDGVTTLTLSNGSSVVLSKNGVLTIEDGRWATIAADGTITPLGAKLGDAIDFKVENGELKVSYDGTTYEATGVKVSDYTAHVIGNVVVAEDGKSVSVTIGSQTLELPLVTSAVASLGLSRENFFLRYSGEKTISITAENLSDVYVMNEPDGWKATIDGSDLKIVAPTKKALEIGAAEEKGLVLVHATTDEGKCVVAKLDVTAGPGLTMTVDVNGNITIENAYASQKTSMWGEVSFGFDEITFGFATPSEFLKDPKAYVEFCNTNYQAPNWDDFFYPMLSNVIPSGEYVEGVYEKDILKFTANEAYSAYTYSDIPAGAHIVIWAAPATGKEGAADLDELLYVEYVNLKHNVTVKEVSHSNFVLSTDLVGAESYIVGLVAESAYNNEYNPATFEEYMCAPMGGRWSSFINYSAPNALGMVIPAESMTAEINAVELNDGFLLPGENYKIWIMPLLAHKNKLNEAQSYPEEGYFVYDYSAYNFEADFLPFVVDVKTNDLVAGGSYEATYTVVSTYDAINVDVTLAEGTESVYYNWYSVDEYNAFETDEAVISDLFANCYTPLTANGNVSKTYLNPGQSYVLASVSIGTDGKYGAVKAETLSTLALNKVADITVALKSVVDDGTNYVVTVAVTGATRVVTYGQNHSETATSTQIDGYKATFENNTAKYGAKATYSSYWFADVANGEATLTIAKTNFKYKNNLYVNAVNIKDGVVSAQAQEILAFNIADEAAKTK